MATYKAEVLHQTYRGRPRPAAHYSLGWLPRWAALAARAPGLANGLLAGPLSGPARRLAGVDPRRPLPRFATRTLRAWWRRRPPAGPPPEGPRVLLWPDTFTDHFDPAAGQAAVRVLEAAGYRVDLPDEPLCCGLTWISTGQLTTARRILRRTVDRLAALVEAPEEGGERSPRGHAGVRLVGLEPSCLAVLRHDALGLLGPDDPAAQAVARSASTLAEVLVGTPGWAPPDLRGVAVVAQPHCHQHAVLGWAADRDLLARAGAKVTAVGGCCGLAGNFGVERGHHDLSVAVAETALLPTVRAAPPDAVVLADGFSCRTQLAHLAGRRALHLAELLAPAADGADGPPVSSRRGRGPAGRSGAGSGAAGRGSSAPGPRGGGRDPGAWRSA
jgi:Fe-S oxidoreductase